MYGKTHSIGHVVKYTGNWRKDAFQHLANSWYQETEVGNWLLEEVNVSLEDFA